MLTPLSAGAVNDVWLEVLEHRLLVEVRRAEPGQCLRIDGLPRVLLERAIERVHANAPTSVVAYLVDHDTGPEPWRVGVHKVVEARNRNDHAVLAAFPPDIRLAAGDSVDVSTFREIPTEDVGEEVGSALWARMPTELRPVAQSVLSDLARRGWSVSESARHEFLALIVHQGLDERWVVGASLFALGLVPDFGLPRGTEEIAFRLGQLNVKTVNLLSTTSGTVHGRVLRLPLSDTDFQRRLLALISNHPEGVRGWGSLIATDPSWRDLALENWPLEDVPELGEVRIEVSPLNLPRRQDDGLAVYDPSTKLTVAWKTTPPPSEVVGLASFRVEMLDADRVVVWETPLIKRGSGKTANRNRTVRGLTDLEPGVHFFRVNAYTEGGDPFPAQRVRNPESGEDGKRTNETEDFLLLGTEEIEDSGATPAKASFVPSFTEAELLARLAAVDAGKDPESVGSAEVAWETSIDASTETARATLRFDLQRLYTIRLSQRLRRLEIGILANPDDGGHRILHLAERGSAPEPVALSLPPEVATTRRAALEALAATPAADGAAPVTVLADLCKATDLVESYAHSYRAWLETGDKDALRLDVTRAYVDAATVVALVSPTHPARLLWHLQEQTLARSWTHAAAALAERPVELLATFRESFAAAGIPHLLVLGAEEGYLDAGSLPGGWGAYLPPRHPDSRSVLSTLRMRLGAGAAHTSEADVPPRLLAEKLDAFLRQHTYTRSLVLNVINPGDAALVVDALVDLEARLGAIGRPMRFDVRLFADETETEVVGQAFRDLMEPDRQLSDAAARLAGPGTSFLFPKLAWSRRKLRRFLDTPQDFPAHVTLILDAFPVRLRIARPDATDRSSFVHGLVQEAPRRFVGRGDSYAWIRRPAPAPCPELHEAPERSGLLAGLLRDLGIAQAGLLGPGTEQTDITAVSSLDLSNAGHSLLYAAHLASTWVLTLDANLGLDYFDSASRIDRPGYLLDFTPEFVTGGGRQLLLTTRVSAEVGRIVGPALEQLGLDADGPAPLLLIECLRSLSGRLTLQLQSAPSQVQGALGMALSRLFLEAHGLLEQSIVIPLDAHPELAAGTDPEQGALRGDLLLVSADPEERQLDFLLVETKCHGGTGLGSDLRARIEAQLSASEQRLRELFEIRELDDRIDRAVQSWQLTTVLGFYLERAVRYGLVTPEAAPELRSFFNQLDSGYALSIRRVGLVFRLDAQGSTLDQEDPGLPIWTVGGDSVSRLVQNAMRVLGVEDMQEAAVRSPGGEATTPSSQLIAEARDTEPTWDEFRNTFGGPLLSKRLQPGSTRKARSDPGAAADRSGPSSPTGADPLQLPGPSSADAAASQGPFEVADRSSPPRDQAVASEVSAEPSRPTDTAPPSPSRDAHVSYPQVGPNLESAADQHTGDNGAGLDFEVLLGDTRPTPQYGLLANVAAEPWRRVALDLNGCNTIAVFGVQGGGKSYTLGSIIEMAARPIRNLNELPRPLATVVFHYHQTQDYPPEFVSMIRANDNRHDVDQLRALDVSPTRLEDVLVLTTGDTLDRRQHEFPDVTVAPISFSSSELTVADWRFLMGATGNDALYLRVVDEVMRANRDRLTLASIRSGLAQAALSDAQRNLASTRLDFAQRFIDDTESLRDQLRPGRLIVVDLRDEFVERDQALGLFVTMLNVFSGAGIGEDGFNKLIVFDEAHKYMGGALIGNVVEVIREMRHKGVSVVVASQDPVNVPPSVIELSSIVCLHRFNSPNWLRHIQKSLTGLGDLTPAVLNALQPGEGFLWSNRATDPTFSRRAVKVKMRPRVTKHGGSTRTAL